MQKDIITREERIEIVRQYRRLLKNCKNWHKDNNLELIRKAFDLSYESHKHMRRKSGEPFFMHPLSVAQIVTEDIGLGTTAVICALLHDVVEDTEISLDTIRERFGEKVAKIVDGLTKISVINDKNLKLSDQSENFRKIILTLADDVRVILIKLADRLHNMRTMDSMPRHKQLNIASETMFLYAPLAHRLGLYEIKTELEDLSFKYKEPALYREIKEKVDKTEENRKLLIQRISLPIISKISNTDINYNIKGRTKSIFSIWKKMSSKNIPFEEVFDLFAIRIIIDTPKEKERDDCWRVYSMVTDIYRPNPTRLRDWITTPKANGYESLHTTVLASKGRWIEVQIRTKRMDEIAEKGYAAHWKYKESDKTESALDAWLKTIRELLEKPENNLVDFIDDFKLALFTDEINVFTPAGDVRKLPKKSTVLDFAFDIHSEIGGKCIGAKINQKLVPLNTELKSGDTIEIITSEKAFPKIEWLDYVISSKAKTTIKDAVRKERRKYSDVGAEFLKRKLKYVKVDFDDKILNELKIYFQIAHKSELYYRVYNNLINIKDLKTFADQRKGVFWLDKIKNSFKKKKQNVSLQTNSDIEFDMKRAKELAKDNDAEITYSIAICCNPIPGDEIFGYFTSNNEIKIHKTSCSNATYLMSNKAQSIVKAKWTNKQVVSFLTGIKLEGIDNLGLLHKITGIISTQLNVNISSVNFEGHHGVFEGVIMLYVNDTKHLEQLIEKIKKIKGVRKIERIERAN